MMYIWWGVDLNLLAVIKKMNELTDYIKKGIPLSDDIQNKLEEITVEKKVVKGEIKACCKL